jgi:ABC-type dipeptide/oligopeptide/nickel transport system ATPase component
MVLALPVSAIALAAVSVAVVYVVARGWWPSTGVVVLVGDSGSGKTTVVMALFQALTALSPKKRYNINPFGRTLPPEYQPLGRGLIIEVEKEGMIARKCEEMGYGEVGSLTASGEAAAQFKMLTHVVTRAGVRYLQQQFAQRADSVDRGFL